MDYSKYQKSRDLSWQMLIENNITSLPVKISTICKALDIPIISYQDGYAILEKANQLKCCTDNDGLNFGGAIFYNQNCSVARQRFTVAHELGHCLMHNGKGLYNHEPSETDNPIEQEANVFASRILAPACVLWGIGVTKAEQISELCNISMQSAEFRMERMNELYIREQTFLRKYNKSCFLMSPLERQIYQQFKPYILANKL